MQFQHSPGFFQMLFDDPGMMTRVAVHHEENPAPSAPADVLEKPDEDFPETAVAGLVAADCVRRCK